jgi:hypothetical protein
MAAAGSFAVATPWRAKTLASLSVDNPTKPLDRGDDLTLRGCGLRARRSPLESPPPGQSDSRQAEQYQPPRGRLRGRCVFVSHSQPPAPVDQVIAGITQPRGEHEVRTGLANQRERVAVVPDQVA